MKRPDSWVISKTLKENSHGGMYLTLPPSKSSGAPVTFFAKLWKPSSGKPKATISFIHGLGEHIMRYDDFFRYLADEKLIQVFSYDQRGFGRTVHQCNADHGYFQWASGRTMVLGDIGGWDTALEDIYRACQSNDEIGNRVPGVPHYIYGHSMGGLLVTGFLLQVIRANQFAEEKDPDLEGIRGVIASAPAFRPGFEVPWLKKRAGSLLSHVIGTFNIPTELDIDALCSVKSVVDAYRKDPYVHGLGSLRTLASIIEKGEWLVNDGWKDWPFENSDGGQLRYLLTFGDGDKITSLDAAKSVFENIKELAQSKSDKSDVTMKIYEGMFHELHNEKNAKSLVWDYYADWILRK